MTELSERVRAWSLRITSGPESGKVHLLVGQMVIGRLLTNELPISDHSLARKHAQVTVSNDGLTIEDLGSAGGTFVNRVRAVGAVTLKLGDVIHVGTVELVVERRL